jgi:hypothetical protein
VENNWIGFQASWKILETGNISLGNRQLITLPCLKARENKIGH